ncbi:hypothetical protein ACGFWE_09265 [Streptomyces sp. NPDC048523]|uniref:hypothetical protein n=1 Tax=Streptomyces sp. NPDC048523 TaxID=3365567 RepID=UPI00371719A6
MLAPDRLAALAVEYRDRREGPPPSPPGCADLDRWKVDYLRHRPARYDDILAELSGRTGRAAAEQLLRRRVYAAISQACPALAQECERRCGLPDR